MINGGADGRRYRPKAKAAAASKPMTTIVRLRVLTPGRRPQSSQSAPRNHSRQPLRASRAPQFLQKLELLIVGASGSEARGLYFDWKVVQCNGFLPIQTPKAFTNLQRRVARVGALPSETE